MADTVTTTKRHDGERIAILHFTNESDGTGEASVKKISAASLFGSPGELRIRRICGTCSGMEVKIHWDAATDVLAAVCPTGDFQMDYRTQGGLKNNAGAGKTGDINFTTVGHTSGDSYAITIEVSKHRAKAA